MLYREVGDLKLSYLADQRIFPVRQDFWVLVAVLVLAFAVVPLIASDYWLSAILIPTLALSLAALGLNILTGYCGQLSLGTAAFMSVGAFATYNLVTRVPAIPFPISILIGGVIAAIFAVVVGLPSLRIKGFYLVVATLAAHFFVQWLFDAIKWFKQDNPQGEIKPPPFELYGIVFNTPVKLYLLELVYVVTLALLAKNMMRRSTGRRMMAVRDMDLAAAVMGVPISRTKLLAFAISAFYCGVAGTLYVYCYLQLLDTKTYSLELAFSVMFMIIVGGTGTIAGSFIGTAIIFLVPIWMNATFSRYGVDPSQVQNIAKVLFGALVIYLLIVEPNGAVRLWTRAREKLRNWPFPS
jgi:branched-chain amino acid transport system permease protein